MVRHLTKVSDFTREECDKIISRSTEKKSNLDEYNGFLKGKTLLMLFEKLSLRTRISFETGMQKLGGHAIFYSIKDSR
ncbi:hypothetical protein LCGC14_0874600 [marine sediment metagenome]|uniref:Aspartate/ornithine carbamoyltransferase carbamoyl-P binding domain-containing protein n=1 Tax=marine sediment metagenome TaxID=412755 RepID=A0A0F9SAR2_9ZZZZ|nr:MAG: Ornithine carbamoyltransferase, catabolic [Candidatus Lokiarchaeum sp. GC14_75]